ncbi:MAG: hypothetical protein NVSMB33_05390 [Ktedonobacteraceae bacterium]
MTRALVLRAPGINCDRETAQACRLVGFETDLLHINQLIKAPERLLNYAFLVIPGGFSYGDDLGAGTLLAKNLTLHLGSQLQQFVNEGRLILGICNGFQVLVRTGLLAGSIFHERQSSHGKAIASLTDNASAQFECRWVTLDVEISMCIFTQWIKHPLELPVAHGEGQLVLADETMLARLRKNGQVPLTYARGAQFHPDCYLFPKQDALPGKQVMTGNAPSCLTTHNILDTSEQTIMYPYNPNGSIGNIAGICNKQGNVFGLMPHPERFVSALQHPQRRGLNNGDDGDGLLIFKNAYEYAKGLKVARSAPGYVGAQFLAATSDIPKNMLVNNAASQEGAINNTSTSTSYASSGVDIAAAEHAKNLMKDTVWATQGPQVLAGMGAFAGVFDASGLQGMSKPALVASTDGVGTKTLLAAQAGRFETIGYDLVNHSVNDLLTQGARPLFFMDYLAMGKLDAAQAAAIVRSVAEACREVGCALLGGETAEMPDVYVPGAFDLAGTIVGVVEQDAVINGSAIEVGDVLLGLPSSGLHTNGYSLARRIFAPYKLATVFPELGEPLSDALLRPHRCYLREIERIQEFFIEKRQAIKGMAHITGGSFEGNIARILPEGLQAVIEIGNWNVPPLFTLLARLGQVRREEMYRALNMGVGMVLVFSSEGALDARNVCPALLPVGYITEGKGVVLR